MLAGRGGGGVDGGKMCIMGNVWVVNEADVFNNSIRGWKETIAREVVQNVV